MLSSNCKKKFKKKHKWLIFHDSWLGIIWNTIISICLLYTALILPVQVSFYPHVKTVFSVVEILTAIIFSLDVFVNFNRSFLRKDHTYEVNRKRIAIQYLKTWFVVDFIACVPITRFIENSHPMNQHLKLLKLHKVFNLIRIFRIVSEIKDRGTKKEIEKMRNFFHYINTGNEIFYMQLFTNIIAIHNFACLVYYLPVYYSSERNWVLARNIQHRSNLEKYLFSVHWVIETFVTVGFGENILT